MSTPTDVAKADAFLRFATRVFSFRVPICRPSVDYQASFKSSISAPEAAAFIASLNQSRQDMITALYSAPGAHDQKVKTVDTYLNLVWKLHDAFANQKLQLDKDLSFEWRGSISERPECARSSDVLFEILNLLHTKAIMLSIAAQALLTTDPTAFLSDAAKLFLEASSIVKYMGDNIANGNWNRVFSKRAPNPVELSPYMCFALAALFKGQAQALSFMKAITSGSTPATIRSRLAVGVVNTMSVCLENLFALPDATTHHADLISFAHVMKQFYTALAYQHAAQAYLEKTEVGNAIAFCQAARAHMAEQKSASKPTWMFPGLPKHVGPYAELGNVVAHVNDALNQIQSDAERDNKFVYFQPVPGPYSNNSSAGLPLPDLPPEASVMNPAPYKEVDRSADPPIALEYKAKPSMFSSMFSGLMGGGSTAASAPAPAPATDASAPPAPTTTAPPANSQPPPGPVHMSSAAMSDEAYARSLQQQYDAEAARATAPPAPPAAGGAPAPAPSGAPPPPRYNSLV